MTAEEDVKVTSVDGGDDKGVVVCGVVLELGSIFKPPIDETPEISTVTEDPVLFGDSININELVIGTAELLELDVGTNSVAATVAEPSDVRETVEDCATGTTATGSAGVDLAMFVPLPSLLGILYNS